MGKLLNTGKIFTLTLCVVLTLASCSSDSDNELIFESQIYTVAAGSQKSIEIKSGNGKYELTPGSEGVVTATTVKDKDAKYGRLVISGEAPGESYVTVEDKITGEKVTLKIYVTEPYFSLLMGNTQVNLVMRTSDPENKIEVGEKIISEYPFGEDNFMYHLMKNSNKLYVDRRPGVNTSTFYEGTYQLSKEEGNYILSIEFDMAEKKITRNYLLSGNRGISLLDGFFFSGSRSSDEIMTTRTSIAYFDIGMEEDMTDKFSSSYPDLVYGGLTYSGEASVNQWLNDDFFVKRP